MNHPLRRPRCRRGVGAPVTAVEKDELIIFSLEILLIDDAVTSLFVVLCIHILLSPPARSMIYDTVSLFLIRPQ